MDRLIEKSGGRTPSGEGLAKQRVTGRGAKDVTSAFALFRKMEDEDLTPDVPVYTVLIDGLVKIGQIAKAWEWFWQMRTWKQLQPDEVLSTPDTCEGMHVFY